MGDWGNFTENGTSESRTHNGVHEITGIGILTSPTHDPKGNTTYHPYRGQLWIGWDQDNQLTSVTCNLGASTYKYDALGRRIAKTHGGATIVYVASGPQELAEYTSGISPSSPTRMYIYGAYVDEPLMMIVGLAKHYYHANALYSIAAITDASGAVVERYMYSAYGAPTIYNGAGTTVLSTSAVGSPWRFTGRRIDAETGLLYSRSRFFDIELGRFLSRDRIRYVDGPNLYTYVGNGPTN